MTRSIIGRLPEPGRAIIAASWLGTVIFSATAVAAVLWDQLQVVSVVVALVLFAIGTVAFLVAFAAAVERSRTEEIAVSSLYFLAGSAPKAVRRHLLGSTTLQIVVAIVTAAARPFTGLAFGILVPMYGLAMAGLWAARYGTFPDRIKLRPKKVR